MKPPHNCKEGPLVQFEPKEAGEQKQKPNGSVIRKQWLLHAIQGVLIGGCAIIPGMSGGVLCVTFGVYQPLIALMAHPFETMRREYQLFIPFFIGWVIGFLALAGVVAWLFQTSATLAITIFVGLIAGTLPSLFCEAGKNGSSKLDWSLFTISLIVLYSGLNLIESRATVAVTPNFWWYLFCGIIWGLSLVLPGLNLSSFLIYLGLFQPMTAGIANLNFSVILPFVAGFCLVAGLAARFVNYLIQRWYHVVAHVILGIVIASTLLIIPSQYKNVVDLIAAPAGFAGGFAVAWLMNRTMGVVP